MTCRRSRIQVKDKEEIVKVRELVKQYGKKASGAGRDALGIILEAVRRSVDPMEDSSSKEPMLKIRLVHMWVKKILESGTAVKTKANKAGPDPKNKFNNFQQREYDHVALEKLVLERSRTLGRSSSGITHICGKKL